MGTKFKVGDKVEIVNYGHLIWENKKMPLQRSKLPIYSEDEDTAWVDISPSLIGKKGVITECKKTQGIDNYSISEIGAWYCNDQLKLRNK